MAFEKNLVVIAIFIILGTLASQATSSALYKASIAEKHEQWMAEYGRVYPNSTEKERRFAIFKKNAEFVEDFNNKGNKPYELSINQFSDMTNEEFLRHHTGYTTPINSSLTTSSSDSSLTNSSEGKSYMYQSPSTDVIPASLDWREQGAVTPIKHQHRCNVCWAFAAVAAVEGITFIKTGKLVSLSAQQLLECDKIEYYENFQATGTREGCQGGDIQSAFEYIKKNGGIAREENYPYLSTALRAVYQTCDAQKETEKAAQIADYEMVPSNNQSALLKAVSMQPVSIAIDGRGVEFQHYHGGVFTGPCGYKLIHAVTIIGYGTEKGTNYWLIKNSWGTTWGENGYMKIRRTEPSVGELDGGLCGLAKHAFYPIV